MKLPRLWPLFRVRVVFKGGATMTFDTRGFMFRSNGGGKEVLWQTVSPHRHETVMKIEPDEVVGVTYRIVGYTLRKPAKEFQ